MLLVISPAKKLDFSPVEIENNLSKPLFQKDATNLANVASKLSKLELKQLMSISDKLADLNFQRFQSFKNNPTEISTKAAAFAFNGDTYTGLSIMEFSKLDLDFSQKHLRILSGLYGLLRPLDLIQPYRLEMGSNLKNDRGHNLYQYWSDIVSNNLNLDLEKSKNNKIINLASVEYSKVINTKIINADIINPQFLEEKNNTLKNVSFFSKKARGSMARFILKNKILNHSEIKDFNYDGYKFNPSLSSELKPVFTRKSLS